MNVVRNASHKHRLATPGVDELSNVGVKTFQMFLFDGWANGFNVEDDVNIDLTERL